MKRDAFDQQIEAARRHLATLRRRANAAPEQQPLLQETLKELSRALKTLRDIEVTTRAIVDAAVDGIVTIDERGIVQSFNPAAEQLFRYSAEEVIGESVKMLMPAPYHDEHDNYLANYLKTGVKKIIGIGREVVGQRKDGTTFPIDLAVSEVRTGTRRLFTGIVRDVAARKRAEQAVRDSEALFHAFMSNSPTVQFMKDQEGRYVFINAAYERLFRISLADIRGKTDFDILPPEVARTVRANDRAALDGNQTLELFETVPTPGGGPSEWMVFKFPFTDAEGRRFVGGVAVDVTERKRAEAQLREFEKLAQQRERLADIGAITAQIVHDVGNPLAGISMQAQLILHRAQRDAGQPLSTIVKPAERIFDEVRRLDSLIKEFMEFSHEQRLDLKPVNLPHFLRQVVDLWQPVAAERGIALTIQAPRDMPSLTADEEKLHRVFDNLVKNAIEAINQGPGTVDVHITLPAPEAVRFVVSDTGPGIPETVQVFRLFETTKVNGSGIGLAVARQIVLAHRGTIDYSCRRPRGTVFRVELPRSGPLT